MPRVGQHDCFVEAVLVRLRLGQRAVDVDAGHLGPGGDGGVVYPAPAHGSGGDPVVGVQVVPKGDREDREGVGHVVQPHADHRLALVGDRPDVDVLPVAVAARQLEGDVAQLVYALGKTANGTDPKAVYSNRQTAVQPGKN